MELGIAEIHHRYTQYARVTLYRQMKLYIELEVGNSYHKNSVQQRKASVCDFRLIIGNLKSLGKTADTFPSTNTQEGAHMNATVSKKAVTLVIHKHGNGCD